MEQMANFHEDSEFQDNWGRGHNSSLVGVHMRKPDCVDRGDLGRQKLESQFRRRVDKYPSAVDLDQGTVASPMVSGIGGGTRGAVAPNHGNAKRGSGTEEGEIHAPTGGRDAWCSSTRTRGMGCLR